VFWEVFHVQSESVFSLVDYLTCLFTVVLDWCDVLIVFKDTTGWILSNSENVIPSVCSVYIKIKCTGFLACGYGDIILFIIGESWVSRSGRFFLGEWALCIHWTRCLLLPGDSHDMSKYRKNSYVPGPNHDSSYVWPVAEWLLKLGSSDFTVTQILHFWWWFSKNETHVFVYVFSWLFTEALLIASKEIGLEVNAEKTKYMVMSRDQNAGQNGYIQIGNKLFETVEQFKYLGTTLTNQNSIHEEINLLSSSLLSKSVKIKIYRTCRLFCMGVKPGRSHWGKNVGWGFSRIRCWGGYLGPRRMR
jgi:hypothetical protein